MAPSSTRHLIRPAQPEDLLACTTVWRRNEDPALPLPERAYPLYGHERDTGTLLVAEAPSGAVMGFGASLSRDGRWFLADLFVDPAHHGAGVGRALVDQLVAIDRPGARRATMASSDHRALGLYIGLGMIPRWPCFYLSATSLDLLPARAGRLEVDTVETTGLAALARDLSYDLYPEDVAYWSATLPIVTVAVTGPGGHMEAVALVRWATPFAIASPAAVSLGPILTAPDGGERGVAPGEVLAALLHWIDARRSRDGDAPVRLYVPGSHPWLTPALESGFHINDFDLFCASPATRFDPTVACPSHDLL